MKTVLRVSGMTCDHCVQSVTKEVSMVPGVTDVSIELHSSGPSTVSVSHGGGDILGNLAGAIANAGYTLEAVVSQS